MWKVVPVVLMFALATLWSRPEPVVSGSSTVVFPLSITGKTYQPGVTLNPGVKCCVGKLNDKVIAAVLQGTLPDFASQYLDLDPSGRFFVYFDGRNSDGTATFRVATNPNGTDTTTLDALVTNDGIFWAVGEYDMPLTSVNAVVNMTGKMKFEKGTYIPKKITGTFNFIHFGEVEAFSMKFKTLKPVS